MVAAIALMSGATLGPFQAIAQAPTGKEKEQTLYAIGTLVARQLVPLALSEAELAQVQKGIRDAALGQPLEVQAADFREQINTLTETRQSVASAAESTEAKKFVDAAAAEKGALRTDTGLIYIEETAGSGASPGPEDTVEVHYHGTLRDGTVFDSSVDRGTPAKFPLNRVIPCWTEGLQRMKVGGKSRLVCPASIAYGDRGAPPRIPGGAALSFDVELLAIGE